MIISSRLKLTSLCLLGILTISGCYKKYSRETSSPNNGDQELTPSVGNNNLSITFNGNAEYTSSVIYLIKGTTPKLAIDAQGFPTMGGYDGASSITTDYNGISFNSSLANVDSSKLNITLADDAQDPFCKNLNISIQNSNIVFTNDASNKLSTLTSCSFKLTSNYYNLNQNKINLQFNYTVTDWMNKDLGGSTKARDTALLLNSSCKTIGMDNCLNINYEFNLYLQNNTNVVDISPITVLNNLVLLDLESDSISNVPDSLLNLKNLKSINLQSNKIQTISPSIINWIQSISSDALQNNPGYPNFGN